MGLRLARAQALATLASLVTCALLPATAGAADCVAWPVDYAASELAFTAVQADAEFQGSFGEFTAGICFTPDTLERSRFDVTVELASVDTRNGERDEVLTGPDFFAVARFPSARFVATEFRAAGDDRHIAEGQLTLRGVTMPLSIPFSFEAPGAQAAGSLAGEVTVSRLAFGVGQGEWQDTTWVGDRVEVRFSLVLLPSAEAEPDEPADD